MIGVVVMAYGTPRSPADIAGYYTDIRRGRPPTPEQLADLIRRYDAIGGISPLAQRTEAQRAALARSLGPGYRVILGLKHADPKIEAAIDELADERVERIVGVVLAPHYSRLSVGEYLSRARTQSDARMVTFSGVDSWHLDDTYLGFLAASVTRQLSTLPARTLTLFTAHSLPARVIEMGDPYPEQLAATAAAIAERCSLGSDWRVAWQSAGRTPEPWLGPDVLDVLTEVADDEYGYEGVLVCPCGFTSDHLEILYDLDIETAHHATSLGLAFGRTDSVNDDPNVMAALARLVAAQ